MRKFLLIVLLMMAPYVDALNYEREAVSIESEAVVIGDGKTRIYAFIDPLCEKSQSFFELISENDGLKSSNTYFLFLYGMQKYDSAKLIRYIYSAKDTYGMMRRVMVEGYMPDLENFLPKKSSLDREASIKRVADKFKAQRRPYLLVFKKGSKYCKVSEGTAPCLESSENRE